MVQVENKFAGHIRASDPRSLLFGASGCVWPTIPAFRYRAMSTNATGDFAELNGDGLLLPLLTALPATGFVTYGFVGAIGPLEMLLAGKGQELADGSGYHWEFILQIACQPALIRHEFQRPFEKCNRDVPVGAIEGDDPDFGTTGDSFIIRQVEWDEADPPI